MEDGPYLVVRHPGHLGTIVTWVGFGLTSGDLGAAAAEALPFGRTYARRIAAEERTLERSLVGYDACRRRTRRLVPFVW